MTKKTKTRITSERFEEYTDRLQKKFTRLGNGAFAEVYPHSTLKNVVVKVFCEVDDMAYAKYLRWCEKNQKNPYVPKIHAVERFKHETKNEQITVVFMERLNSVSAQQIKEFSDRMLDDDGGYGNHIGELFDPQDWVEAVKSSKDKHFKKFAKFMQTVANDHGVDLHRENIMMRPRTNQLVFTDPIA